MIPLLLACAKPPPAAPAVQEAAAIDLQLKGRGPCRRFVFALSDYGTKGTVYVEDDPDSETVDCGARAEWWAEPLGHKVLQLNPDGSSVGARLMGATWVNQGRLLLTDATGRLDWVVQVADRERREPPSGETDPLATFDLDDRFIVVFEVTAKGVRGGDVTPFEPSDGVSAAEHWKAHEYSYCNSYFTPVVYRSGDLTLNERHDTDTKEGLVPGVNVWCSQTHANVFAMELRDVERQPIDVRLELPGGGARLMRLHVGPSDTISVVSLLVEVGLSQ